MSAKFPLSSDHHPLCVSIKIAGAVQGVGFRPFVYRLARAHALTGWVRNSPSGVEIEAAGDSSCLETFVAALRTQAPSAARINALECQPIAARTFSDFRILASVQGEPSALVLPDLATCPDCVKEIFDPSNRRFHYPLTNCIHCGPRYSIVTALPYDRSRTTMNVFEMCADCRREYENPDDRRFHAQPNACPVCGPRVECVDRNGRQLACGYQAIEMIADEIRRGKIAAVKGIGGFHLMADACDAKAVGHLRQRKRRARKPFAVMCANLEEVRRHVHLSVSEAKLLAGPGAPIVLVRRQDTSAIVDAVAPGNPDLGVMLAYTPVHHLLMDILRRPLVATSANITDEPMCIDNTEALERLKDIADVFLIHNRRIARPADDSVIRMVADRPLFLRRGRGFAPTFLAEGGARPGVVAVGAHQKNTVAVSIAGGLVISAHVGDLDAPESRRVFEKSMEDLRALYDQTLRGTVCDRHPDYASTLWARNFKGEVQSVQHHHAHAAACLLDNGIDGDALAVVWDGTGLGDDGTIWGGEFLKASRRDYQRIGCLRPFPLIGGEAASRETWRCALSVLLECFGEDLAACRDLPMLKDIPDKEMNLVRRMRDRRINTPMTSSAGRLFDAVAALTGLCLNAQDEAEAAMALESAARVHAEARTYPSVLTDISGQMFVADWRPMVRALVSDLCQGRPAGEIAASFHASLAEIIVAAARRCDLKRVILTGGVFQNKLLAERTINRLREEGFEPFWSNVIPPNDGGIAAGQLAVAMARTRE